LILGPGGIKKEDLHIQLKGAHHGNGKLSVQEGWARWLVSSERGTISKKKEIIRKAKGRQEGGIIKCLKKEKSR